MANIQGDLSVTVVKGTKLQNPVMFGMCNPFIIAKLRSSTETMTTTVKDGETDPVWQESFTFRNASASDALQICLMEKMPTSAGVVSLSKLIFAGSWGYPGVGGVQSIMDLNMPPSLPSPVGDDWDRASVGDSMGTVRVVLRFRAGLPFRAFPPLTLLRVAASKTGVFTEKFKVDLVVENAMNLVQKPISLVVGLSKSQKMAAGGAVAVAGGGIALVALMLSVPVVIMSLIFLPLTLMGGAFAAMVACALVPFVLAIGWILLCCRPIQCRIWQPCLFKSVTAIRLINVLLLNESPVISGKDQ